MPNDFSKLKHNYEVKPTNFFTLSEEKQKTILSNFYSLLASIQEPLYITMIKEPLDVQIGNEIRHLQILKTFMSSAEPLDWALDRQGFDYFVAPNVVQSPVKNEFLKHLVLENEMLAKCYTLYSISSTLSPAWIHSLLPVSHAIMLNFIPLEQDNAVAKLRKKVHLMRSTQSTNPKILDQIRMGLETISALEKNNTKLLTVVVNVLIQAENLKSLKECSKQFVKQTKISLSSFDNTFANQVQMLEGFGKKLYVELGSCAIFYPFVSADMLEVPNGIIIGVNYVTGAPVVYNYSMRENYNILILAGSGAGKSVTAKLIMKRLMEKYPDALIFVVDPQGEYEIISKYLSIESVRITSEKQLGFDPFKMFAKSSDAVNVLCEIAQTPILVANSFLAKCDGIKSLDEFYEKLSDEEKKYLINFVNGPMATLFKGQSVISDRTIISLKGTYAEDYVAKISFLALAKLWKKIESTPVTTPKILVIDEGHLIFRFASAAKFVDLLARMGRKMNVIFIFISQRVEDVTKSEAGRAFFDNSETKIILRNNEMAAEELGKSLQLSSHEKEMIQTFVPGDALILTRDYRIRVSITPSKEELDLFDTSPMNTNAT